MVLVWTLSILVFLLFIFVDLFFFHKKGHVLSVQGALKWSLFWVVLALLFNVGIYFMYESEWIRQMVSLSSSLSGREAALQFFSGYILERSLSLDNIFVIALVFSYFGIPKGSQYRILVWGILGAIVLRGIMITIGFVLFEYVWWIIYVFGGFLILTAIKMLILREGNLEPNQNFLIRIFKRFFRYRDDPRAQQFFVKEDNKGYFMTPLFLTLLMVESMDLVFALDSIPAIFAITRDPFLVFTSNVFAIFGLRALYLVLIGLMEKFKYIKISLVFMIAFIGIKMIVSHHYKIPIEVTLVVIVGILVVGILASLMAPKEVH